MRAFGRLSEEQAMQLAEVLDESLLIRSPDLEKMRAIAGSGFTDRDLVDLAVLYTELLATAVSDDARRDVDSCTGLGDDDKRPLLASVAEKMRGAADAGKIRENLALGSIRSYGHPHMHRLGVYTEFRPVSSGGAIRRLVPHLVVDGLAYKDGQAEGQPIRFQMDPESAERFLDDIKSGIDALRAEIKDMRGKFGDDAVVD